MEFIFKKAENCFSDAENYEYRIDRNGEEFLKLLNILTVKLHINDQLRRPTFTGELADGTRVKGILSKPIIKVGYNLDQATRQKHNFEEWLASL